MALKQKTKTGEILSGQFPKKKKKTVKVVQMTP